MANPDLMTGLGAALAIFLSSTGSVVASIQGGVFALQHGGTLFSFFPIVIAGVLAIYGIIVAVLLCGQSNITEQEAYQNFSAGLCVGLACLMSGIGMAKFLEKHMQPTSTRRSTTGTTSQEQALLGNNAVAVVAPMSTSLLMVMVFLEAIGLYGLIVALILQGH